MKAPFTLILLIMFTLTLRAQYILPKEVYSPSERRRIDSIERNQDFFIRTSKAFARAKKQEIGGKNVLLEKTMYSPQGLPTNIWMYWGNERQIHHIDVGYSYDEEGYVVKRSRTEYDNNGNQIGAWEYVYTYELVATGKKALKQIKEYYTPDYGTTKQWATTRYTYNAKGWLITVEEEGDFVTEAGIGPNTRNTVKEYSYDLDGRPIKCTMMKGGVKTGWEETYTYDKSGKLTRVVSGKQNESPTTHDYVYHANGSVKSKRDFYNYTTDSTLTLIEYSELNSVGQFAKSLNKTTFYEDGKADQFEVTHLCTYDDKGLLIKDIEEQEENDKFLFRKSYTLTYYFN